MRRASVLLLCCLVGIAAGEKEKKEAPKPDRKELDALLAETDDLTQTVAALRGLKLKKTFGRGILDKEQVKARVLQKLAEEYTDEEVAAEGRAYQALGLLPADLDYRGLIVDLFSEQIAGFYDPDAKELNLADWIEASSQRYVLVHEIAHVLQDQAFDLGKFTKPVKDDGDAQLARQALVEGDALAVMIEFMYREDGVKTDPWADDSIVDGMAQGGGGNFPKFDAAPLVVREALMFPYTGGLRLLAAARRHNSWKRIDEMWKKPPVSTEQVLHPRKYFEGEKPIVVKWAQLSPFKKRKPVYVNVLGELVLSVLFRQHGLSEARAREAAEGWGGDRLVMWSRGAEDDAGVVVISFSVWDAEADAIEAYDAFVESLEHLHGKEGAADAKGDRVAWDGSFVERRGAKVAVVVGAPADDKKLRTVLWSKWK
jgi:hypothetical protein